MRERERRERERERGVVPCGGVGLINFDKDRWML
jgi:hypothetical protein